MKKLIIAASLLFLVSIAPGTAMAADASLNASAVLENEKCFSCHTEQRVDCLPIVPLEFYQSAHGLKNVKCATCHSGYTDKRHPLTIYKYDMPNYDEYLRIISAKCKSCHKKIFLYEPYDKRAYPRSVHKDIKCEDCHEFVPNIHKPKVKDDHLRRAHEACKKCHKKEAEQFNRSLHAMAIEKGKKAPDCVMCHGSHWTQSLKKRAKSASFKNLMLEYCSDCHSNRTSSGNFHFQAVKLGYSSVPSCYNCHGAHDNEELFKNSKETVAMCKKCHKKEKSAFFNVSIHGEKKSKLDVFEGIMATMIDWRFLLGAVVCITISIGIGYTFRRKRSAK